MSLPAGPLESLEVRQAPLLAAWDYVWQRGEEVTWPGGHLVSGAAP